MARLSSGHNQELNRYLLDGERLVTAVHQHWGKVAEPLASAVAGGILALWVDANIDPGLHLLATLLWWVWFALVARAIYRIAEWRHDWFVATDKRLLLFYGFITRKVSMMPLSKVTDMSYNRSVPGRVFGYGRFIMESAGQDQALREVNWVPQPDHHYRAICAEIFGVVDHEQVFDFEGDADAPDGETRGPHDHRGQHHAERPDPYPGWDEPRHSGESVRQSKDALDTDHSTAIRIRPPRQGGRDSLYRSPDLRRDDREADTGPIPVYPPKDPRER